MRIGGLGCGLVGGLGWGLVGGLGWGLSVGSSVGASEGVVRDTKIARARVILEGFSEGVIRGTEVARARVILEEISEGVIRGTRVARARGFQGGPAGQLSESERSSSSRASVAAATHGSGAMACRASPA